MMKVIIKHATQSTFTTECVSLPTPCNDVIYYPTKIHILAAEGTYIVFKTRSQKSGLAYLVIAQPGTTKIVLAGSTDSISEVYHAIPWPTYKIAGEDNQFDYKESPSLQVLEDYFAQLKEQ
ncbi:hypothetical protein [Priestia megaterium]|uniref:hypothetical protein n=1 Tax=Priestia megaterium TaxID=1404 RepID=UPI003672DC3E